MSPKFKAVLEGNFISGHFEGKSFSAIFGETWRDSHIFVSGREEEAFRAELTLRPGKKPRLKIWTWVKGPTSWEGSQMKRRCFWLNGRALFESENEAEIAWGVVNSPWLKLSLSPSQVSGLCRMEPLPFEIRILAEVGRPTICTYSFYCLSKGGEREQGR